MAFTHLHCHTKFSLLDGQNDIKAMVKEAKKMGMTALAITDHGVAYGLPSFTDACNKEGIKPIIGVEFYEAPEDRFERTKSKSEEVYYHIILLVKNDEGYKNLCKLVTRSNTEGFYYKPRIDLKLLEENHEGLICLSACIQGRVAQDIIKGNIDKAEEDILKYKSIFGEDYYLEIQNHGIPEELQVAEELVRLSAKHNIKLVCTNDSHYLKSEDAEAHEWLLCMQTGKTLKEDHMKLEGDYSLKSEEDMRKLYPNLPEAFDNTMEVAEKVDFDLSKHYAKGASDYRMPKVKIPSEWGNDYFGYLEHLAWEGYEKRYPEGHAYREQAKPRLEYELSIIKQMGFAEYFLDTLKTIEWARKNGIIVGVGRGSGAGSVMNYCLTITDLEPLRYGLIFERFLNPKRVSMPDIDVDYDYAHKSEVVQFEAEDNGLDKFCKIQTVQSMFCKSVIRACVKVAGFPTAVGNDLAKLIPDVKKYPELVKDQKPMTLKFAREHEPEIQAYLSQNVEYQHLWEIAEKLEGSKKSGGTHACGHIPTPVPCEELFPCRVDKESGYLVCEYDMKEAEHLGNLKKDLLMLRNLTIIQVAHDGVLRHYNKDIPLWNDEILYDKGAFELFHKGDTNGVFQFESEGMKSFMAKLKPDCFEDIIAGVALYRPGPMDFIPQYIEGKKHPEDIKYPCPELKPILETTYGVIVYQEQVMKICTDLAGFDMGDADIIRKAMGKKDLAVMNAKEVDFKEGCKKNNIPDEVSDELWRRMKKFAEYAFNKSHAACYAAIAMQTAYYKAHYPLEYMAGLLSSVMDKQDKFIPYYLECKEKEIPINLPNINKSLATFSADKDSLIYGLASIKMVTKGVIDEIVKEREQNGEYTSLKDFIERNPKVKKNTLTNMIQAGCFDDFGNRHSMLLALPELKKPPKQSKKTKVMEGQLSLFDDFNVAVPQKEKDYTRYDSEPEYDRATLLKMEKDVTGLYLSGHPISDILRLKDETPIYQLIDEEKEDDENSEEFDSLNLTEEEENDSKEEHKPLKNVGDRVQVLGLFKDIKKIFTKKDNKPMASATIEDETGEIKCVIFPKTYDWVKNTLVPDKAFVIKGTMMEDNNNKLQICVNSIDEVEKVRNNKYQAEFIREQEKIKNNEVMAKPKQPIYTVDNTPYNPCNLSEYIYYLKGSAEQLEQCKQEVGIVVNTKNDILPFGEYDRVYFIENKDGKPIIQNGGKEVYAEIGTNIDKLKEILGEKSIYKETEEQKKLRLAKKKEVKSEPVSVDKDNEKDSDSLEER